MSIGTKGLVGLVAGLAVGGAIAAAGSPALLAAGSAIEVAGKLWINAVLMTIIPLVTAKLVVSIAGRSDTGAIGRAGWRAVSIFLVLLIATAALAAAVMPVVFAWLPIDPAATVSLRSGAGASPAAPGVAQTILELVPVNVVRAASEGAIVPLLVFTIAFGIAATRIPRPLRETLVTFFRAFDSTISVLLHWIVSLAPYGVFALGLGLTLRAGSGIVTALAYYIVVSSGTMLVLIAALYLVVFVAAGMSPLRFARGAAPAQVVAFGTHSSMASLPVMIEGAETRLGLSPTATGFVLPLALAVFKYSGPAWFVVVAHFVARLYGVQLDAVRSVAIVFASVVASLAIGGVPSGAAVVAAPVLAAAGLPVDALGVLLAVDPIPNAFRTVANVTGMMAAAVLADPPRAAAIEEAGSTAGRY